MITNPPFFYLEKLKSGATIDCGCPFKRVGLTNGEATFRGLVETEAYFPLVFVASKGEFYGVPPPAVRPLASATQPNRGTAQRVRSPPRPVSSSMPKPLMATENDNLYDSEEDSDDMPLRLAHQNRTSVPKETQVTSIDGMARNRVSRLLFRPSFQTNIRC
jgi:hypothetical protein